MAKPSEALELGFGGPLVSVEEAKLSVTQQDVASRMRPVQDLDVLVRCPGRPVPNADLIIKIAQDEWRNWHKRTYKRQSVVDPGLSKRPLIKELEETTRRNPEERPIILVPCNKNAPVNLLNVKELLQDGKYVKPDEHKVFHFESSRPEFVLVTRTIGGRPWIFEVRDTAKAFSRSQWLRTVLIVTDGSHWQFNGWPFEHIVDMFSSIKGVYFQQPGLLVPLHVSEWQVDILQLAPIHMDHRFAQTRDKLFTCVEQFMLSHRVKKFVNHTSLEENRANFLRKSKSIL
jgi:parafibromin